MIYFIVRWLRSQKRTRMVQNRSQKLKTVVNNMSELQLTIKDYYIHMEGTAYYGCEEFQIPARMRRAIRSGNFIREYVACKDYQEIHVMNGERVLHALIHDDFHNNMGKELLLHMQNDRLCYAFVDPRQDITSAPLIWGQPPVRDAAH